MFSGEGGYEIHIHLVLKINHLQYLLFFEKKYRFIFKDKVVDFLL